MKRLSILFVGLLSVVLVFSVVGLADEADKIEATVTFNSVIDLFISDTTAGTRTVEQKADGDFTLRDGGSKIVFDSFDVKVTAVTDFNVGASYFAAGEDSANSTDLVSLGNGSLSPNPKFILYNDATSQVSTGGTDDISADISSPPTGSTDGITDVTAAFATAGNVNNLPDGDTAQFTPNVYLGELTQEFNETDSLTIQIAFWAFDASV